MQAPVSSCPPLSWRGCTTQSPGAAREQFEARRSGDRRSARGGPTHLARREALGHQRGDGLLCGGSRAGPSFQRFTSVGARHERGGAIRCKCCLRARHVPRGIGLAGTRDAERDRCASHLADTRGSSATRVGRRPIADADKFVVSCSRVVRLGNHSKTRACRLHRCSADRSQGRTDLSAQLGSARGHRSYRV